MRVLARPWGRPARVGSDGRPVLGPTDASALEVAGDEEMGEAAVVVSWADGTRAIAVPRYPRVGSSRGPARFEGLPRLPHDGPSSEDADQRGRDALRLMNTVLARIGDLEVALDDPARVWARLAERWSRAEREDEPRMAEIVRQSQAMTSRLAALEPRLRRVLRRTRELTPLSRVEEVDRAAMIWLSRQPGRTLAERAGASQRIMAVVRHESLDTPENRVLRAYATLARDVARGWCRENDAARGRPRHERVDRFARRAARLAGDLGDAGVGLARAGAAPNYVLMADPDYRAVNEAWERLLLRRRALDDLWGWQACSWCEFTMLALVLALRGIPGARMVAASPLAWREEHDRGRRVLADNPVAAFHLPREGLILEVQDRPRRIAAAQGPFGAPIWLRVGDLSGAPARRRVPVWPLHAFDPLDPATEAHEAAAAVPGILRAAPRRSFEVEEALVVVPAHGRAGVATTEGSPAVTAMPMGPSGPELAAGRRAIADFLRSLIRSAP